jgi:hypothetical protein
MEDTDEDLFEDVVGDAVRARDAREEGFSKSSAETKWGPAIKGGPYGYQIIPDALVRHQHELGLDATDVVVILNICMHWWESEPKKLPHPRPVTIANRMGTSTRTVERHIARLEKMDILDWLPSQHRKNGPSIRKFNFDKLIQKLEALASKSRGVDKAA